MTKLDDRTTANMEVVLEEVCRELLNGGDHETRKRIAKKLMQSARKGIATLDGLRGVGRAALHEQLRRKSA
jgi:hypothetical protein